MRLLKGKIAKSKNFLKLRKISDPVVQSLSPTLSTASPLHEDNVPSIHKKPIHKDPSFKYAERAYYSDINNAFTISSTKNIVKNYARAICNFICSPVAMAYIRKVLIELGSDGMENEFISYVQKNKDSIDCIERFKEMLVIRKDESDVT